MMMRISYNNRLDQFYVAVDEAGYEESRVVGVFDDNTLILLRTEHVVFTEDDIKRLWQFMRNLTLVKMCEAKDCRNKFVPRRRDQRFCSKRCKYRTAAQRRRRRIKEKENAIECE